MDNLKQGGTFTIAPNTLKAIRADFSAGRADRDETAATIREVHEKTGYLLDPHSAAAYAVAEAQPRSETPMVVLATAHPAKFPDAVEEASGVRPALPDWLGDLMEREEKFTVLPSDPKMVEDYIKQYAKLPASGSTGS